MSLTRRSLLTAFASPLLLSKSASAAPNRQEIPFPERLDFAPFLDAIAATSDDRHAELDALSVEATGEDIRRMLAKGWLSSRELVLSILRRIGLYDGRLNAVLSLNPDLLTIADRLDAERARGLVRSPLHGIPVLLKDNIGTGDRMMTTAGAFALADAHCDRDAFLVQRLRGAGLIVLGKANLSEWAGWLSFEAPLGYSAIGGQTVNPYGEWLSPYGSSAGSAVAVAANYGPFAVGTETMGSIIAPAAVNSVVGMHPSVGLISRDRVIPLFDQMDTAGPLTRTVTDTALLLTALASARDRADPLSQSTKWLIRNDFRQALRPDALQGKRIGLLAPHYLLMEDVEPALQPLVDAGVSVEFLHAPRFDFTPVRELLAAGFRIGIERYLTAINHPGVRTAADIAAFNDLDPARNVPFGQGELLASVTSPLDAATVTDTMRDLRSAARAYIDDVMAQQKLNVILSINNDFSPEYSIAGYPAITVPAGYERGTGSPFGFTFVTGYLADEAALAAAYAFEQASRIRRPPFLI